MLSAVVFIGLVVFSEAGLIHHNHVGIGLSSNLPKGYAARPAYLGRPYNYAIGVRPGPQYATSYLSNPLLLKHAHNPVTVTRVPPQLQNFGAIHHQVALPPSLGSVPLTAPLSNNLLPPVVLNSVPLNFAPVEHTSNLHTQQGIINHQSIINSAPLHTLASTHVSAPSVSNSYTTVEIPEKSVSYSISQQDYDYLKVHKVEGKDSPYKAEPIPHTPENNKHQNRHSHRENDSNPSNNPVHQLDTIDANNNLKRSTAKKRGLLNPNIIHSSLEPSLLQENNQIIFPHEQIAPIVPVAPDVPIVPIVHTEDEYNHINIPEHVVSKHIYFHVPPPDFEEQPRIPITNIPVSAPKKTVNIVFIKVPSQEQRNKLYLQQPLVEDKTLIYVLTKKQDAQDIILPTQEPSKASRPEVYFIKYKTKLEPAADIVNEHEHLEQTLLESDSPILERKRRLEDSSKDISPEKPSC